MADEAIATQPLRHFITYLGGKQEDGSPWSCQLTLTPTGSSDTIPDSFWTQLLNNLDDLLPTLVLRDAGFSRRSRPGVLGNLWRRLFGAREEPLNG